MFTDTPDIILAQLTDTARTNFARMTLGEISFTLSGFAVGRGGYNGTNPVHITPIIGASTALDDQFFPVTGTTPITNIERPYESTIVVNCRLGKDDAIAALGELGVWATIIYSAVNPGEVGTSFLLAISHFPIVSKTLKQAILYRVLIQF